MGQLDKGGHYKDLKKTITVVIAEFLLLPKENEDCINRFRWYNIDNGAMLTDAQEIIIIEMPKLPKDDDGTRFWQWLRFLGLRRGRKRQYQYEECDREPSQAERG